MFEERSTGANYVVQKVGYKIKRHISYTSQPMLFARFCFQCKTLWFCVYEELKKSFTGEDVLSTANFFFYKLYV